MLPTVNPKLYFWCRPYNVLNGQLAKLYCWSPSVRRFSKTPFLSNVASPLLTRSIADVPWKHGSLTVDTVDRHGNVAIPVDLLHILPSLKKRLQGVWSCLH